MPDIILCEDEGLSLRIGNGTAMSMPWSHARSVDAQLVLFAAP